VYDGYFRSRSSVTWEPMNPAPPVSRMRMSAPSTADDANAKARRPWRGLARRGPPRDAMFGFEESAAFLARGGEPRGERLERGSFVSFMRM